MNVQFFGHPEFTEQCFWRKLGLCHILSTNNTTTLKLSQENPVDTCSTKLTASSNFN